MVSNKILHTFNAENEKFSIGFFEFLDDNDFDLKQHTLFQYGHSNQRLNQLDMRYVHGSLFSPLANLRLLILLFKHEKIIIHCLASPWLLFFLYLFPSLNQKVWWVIWGKDLYYYKLLKKKTLIKKVYEFFRKRVFPRIAHLVTSTTGDYELAVAWYGCQGTHHKCLMYPNNIYVEHQTIDNPHNEIRILVGNSADPSNNHLDIFDKLAGHNDIKFKVIVPLSYGDQKYAEKVIARGENQFGQNFSALTELLPLAEYQRMLAGIDIAIFNHKRQQALGNIVALLSDGKKIYLRSDATLWSLLQEQGIKVFDSCADIKLDALSEADKANNVNATKSFFSKNNLLSDLEKIIGNA